MKSEHYLVFVRRAVGVMTVMLAWVGITASVTVDRSPRAAVQDTTVSFSRDVFPILERSCVQCHGGEGDDGEQRIEEGLNMLTYETLLQGSIYGSVVEPGDVDGSMLIEMIVLGDMPKEGEVLSPEEIQIIMRWIAAGAANN